MYLYFSSDYPAIIKLNGIYYGRIDQAPKSINLTDGEPPFVEVCPLTPLEKQINLILDDEFLSSPPQVLSVTDMRGGYFIKFNQTFRTEDFSVIAQEKFSDAVVTVFSENGYKVSIETPFDFFAQTLNLKVDGAKIQREVINGEPIIIIQLFGVATTVACYKTSQKIENVFFRKVNSAEFNGNLKTTELLLDMAKHKINATWEYANGRFTVKEKSIEKSADFNKDLISERLIPYAFLEELSVDGEVLDYLGGTIKDNATRLKDFFGEFVGVFPPPTFRKIEEVGLIYHDRDNLYHVEYYIFSIENRKIINITKT